MGSELRIQRQLPPPRDAGRSSQCVSVCFKESLNFQAEKMMASRKARKFQFLGGLFVILCGILMVGVQLSGWAMYGEKLQLGVAVVILCLGTVLVALSHHHKDAT